MRNLLLVLAFFMVPVLAGLCARASRGLGRQVAVTRFTDTSSVATTIDRQVHEFGKIGLLAIAAFIVVFALTLFTPSWSEAWAPLVGGILGFLANVVLGLSTGIGTNATEILGKPGLRDHIDVQLDMIKRTRRHLRRFLVLMIALTTILTTNGVAMAGASVLIWAIDVSDSVDPAQRNAGIDALIASALESAHAHEADTIQVVKFSDEEFLSDMAWVPVPEAGTFVDCREAEPELLISKGLIGYSLPVSSSGLTRSRSFCRKTTIPKEKPTPPPPTRCQLHTVPNPLPPTQRVQIGGPQGSKTCRSCSAWARSPRCSDCPGARRTS